MPLYRLVRDDGEAECGVDARGDDHALALLGEKLGKPLSFEGPAAPDFLLQVIDTSKTHWRSREGRAVFLVD